MKVSIGTAQGHNPAEVRAILKQLVPAGLVFSEQGGFEISVDDLGLLREVAKHECVQMPAGWCDSVVVVLLVMIRNDRILLVAEEDGIFTLPGGKREHNESDLDCVRREIAEELVSKGLLGGIAPLWKLRHLSPRSQTPIECRIYSGQIGGKEIRPNPAHEIRRVEWMTAGEAFGAKVSAITWQVIEGLSFSAAFSM